MKIRKYLALAASTIMLLAVPVAAENAVQDQLIDLSGYTDEEIAVLLDQVQEEVVDRGIEKSAVLAAGKYEGGKDIPAGSYVMKKEANTADFGIVSLRAADDPEDKFPSKLYEFVDEEDEAEFYITMDEGDILTLPFQVTLTISAGVVFK